MAKKPKTRQDMIEYLTDHFRYHTMNSWNQSTSYARNVKLRKIKFPNRETENRAYDLLDVESAFHDVNEILREFAERHDYKWQIFFNGRSNGYLVLVQGGRKPDEHKRRCVECGQLNFKADASKCGRCGSDEMVDYHGFQTFVYPGRSVDMGEDFLEWETESIAERVDLVWDFDKTVDKAIAAFVDYAKNYRVEEREISVPKKIKVAVKNDAD
jgi:ribosomal protein S27AE